MKALKFIAPLFIGSFLILSCNNDNTKNGRSMLDTTATNPTDNSMDYQPDQSQIIPTPDSSNVIGTDTLNSSTATPNTGTNKGYNDAKANKDSSK